MAGMEAYVIPLAAVSDADAPRVGAKAAVLGRLKAEGFPVPVGLCLTTAAYHLAFQGWTDQIRHILHAHDLLDPAGAANASKKVSELLVELEVPAAVVQALRQSLPDLAGLDTLLAVRSSATAEDAVHASFAGQYHSAIGVQGEDGLHAAVVAVWRSFFSPHALTARASQNSLDEHEAMAILILPVVNAECAGVSLSVDPVQQSRDRTVITAAWGLGTGVVDGSVAADTYWVRRDGATEGFEIEERRVVEQTEQFALDPDNGMKRVPVPPGYRRAACLPRPWLQAVAKFAVAAEVLLGCPQDMEWAIADGQVWVLQSRPITALPSQLARTSDFPVEWASEAERRRAWIHYPYWRHVLKPLERDYAHDREVASEESSLYTGGERFWQIKIVNGRAYATWAPTNLTAGDRRVRRAAMLDLAARLHRQGTTTWEHWGPEIVKATERLSAFDSHSADGGQLADHLEDARGAARRHWSIHGSRLSVSRRPLYTAFAEATGLEESAVSGIVDKLLEGEETPSSRLVDGLYALASTARQVPQVTVLVADPPPDVLDRLAAIPDATAFRSQLEEFLKVYGDRTGVGYGSDATIDMPTWREDPAQVLGYVSPYLDPAIEPPAAARDRAHAEREALIKTVYEGCDDQEIVDKLRRELAYGRRQAAFMEEHNHYIDQMMNGQLRQAILAAARWLVERGALPVTNDVFWLPYAEILSALHEETPSSFADAIARRRARHAEWEKLNPPPILGTPQAQLPQRPPLKDEVTPVTLAGDPLQLIGVGASPGRRRGRARVISTSTFLPELSPGDVLVAQNMGPRWTPLLPILGGLVLDGGAVGQHHAISAREYGVPAVIGTGNATRRIRDGVLIVVDGTEGTVEIEG